MESSEQPLDGEVAALAATLDQVLERLRRVSEENLSLRRGRDQLASERAALLTRNEQARTRVEAMIERLKALESAG